MGHRIPRISPERAAVRMQSSCASAEEAFRVRSLAMKTLHPQMASRHDGPAPASTVAATDGPNGRASVRGSRPPGSPWPWPHPRPFQLDRVPARRFQPSLSKSALGLPARRRWRWCPRLGAQWSSVGLQCRFPLGLVLLISESGGKRLPHVIGHLAQGGDAAVPLPLVNRVKPLSNLPARAGGLLSGVG